MKQWILTLIAVFFISGCSTLQVQVDSDPEYDFSFLNKFNVTYTKQNDDKDFTRSRLRKSLISYFENKGYLFTQNEEADFHIIFYYDFKKRSEKETSYQETGNRPIGRYYNRVIDPSDIRYANLLPRGNMSSVKTTRKYEYEEGRLVVEVLDVKQNTVFWQSIAEDELSGGSSSQEEKSAYLSTLIEKMFKEFPIK